jgi:hypothetical protein
MEPARTAQSGVRTRTAALVAAFVVALGLAFGAGAHADRAQAANLYDVTCSSVNDTIYFTLWPDDYDQWLWYRLWRLDPATNQWGVIFVAPTWYAQPSWNTVGFVGGGPGLVAGSTRNGALTWVTVHRTGWYYIDAQVARTWGTTILDVRHEWVTDYSNITSGLVDRRWCLIA